MTRQAQKYPTSLSQALGDELVMQVCKPWRFNEQQCVNLIRKSHMLDIFGGAGGVGGACSQRGLGSTIIDTSISNKMDGTKSHFLSWLRKQIKQHRVGAVLLATPCASLSLAVSRSGRAIRSQQWPRGIPQGLTLKESERVKQGNAVLDASLSIIRLCVELNIPAILENPKTSYLWCDPKLKRVIASSVAEAADVHQCSFGAHWKKETRFCFFNFETV